MVQTLKRKREIQSEIEDFCDLNNWGISANGNHWRSWWEMNLTIFRRHGRWAWCCADRGETQFSDETFKTEEECLEHLGEIIGVGGV